MHIQVITLFPELFENFLNTALIGKAYRENRFSFSLINPRDFAAPPHHHVDDTPYGGGAGMVMKPEPLAAALKTAKRIQPDSPAIYLSPSGERLLQADVAQLSKLEGLILLCGRYEGIDQRVIDLFVDREISIGDYVTMGGELPAMVLLEATVRLLNGVVGNEQSLEHESFQNNNDTPLLEAPHYTRPPRFQGKDVPEILLSGNHEQIKKWRVEQGKVRTKKYRPDLLTNNTKE